MTMKRIELTEAMLKRLLIENRPKLAVVGPDGTAIAQTDAVANRNFPLLAELKSSLRQGGELPRSLLQDNATGQLFLAA